METASRQLQSKFAVSRSLFEKLPAAGISISIAQRFVSGLNALEMRFALSTGHLYIDCTAGESGRLTASAEFARLLAAEDFSGTVDNFIIEVEGILRLAGVIRDITADTPVKSRARGAGSKRGVEKASARLAGRFKPDAHVCADIQRILNVYPRGGGRLGEPKNDAAGAVQVVDFEHCPACGCDMAVDTGRSVLRCCDAECGAVRELVGTVFDDSQFYSQAGQKAKSGTFNPNRHFQFWWIHILAREPEEEIGNKDDPENIYGEDVISVLRTIVARDRKVLRLLTVNEVRTMLREIDRTDLNKNVPLIMKKLTGVGPPQVSEAIAARVENLFTKAIEIGEMNRADGRINRNYYPYYIYKILDQLLAENDIETRRVLYYIYIQSKETVEADDADWELICQELVEIKYVPTDRTKAFKYRPL